MMLKHSSLSCPSLPCITTSPSGARVGSTGTHGVHKILEIIVPKQRPCRGQWGVLNENIMIPKTLLWESTTEKKGTSCHGWVTIALAHSQLGTPQAFGEPMDMKHWRSCRSAWRVNWKQRYYTHGVCTQVKDTFCWVLALCVILLARKAGWEQESRDFLKMTVLEKCWNFPQNKSPELLFGQEPFNCIVFLLLK